MTEHSPLDAKIYYSANVASKFKTKLDTSSIDVLMGAGLEEMMKEGIAAKVDDLHDPYSLVIFPKTSPSRPYESMMTVLPNSAEVPFRSSFHDFSRKDALKILRTTQKITNTLRAQALENGNDVKDGYMFQHFNPYDLYPKTMFNGSVSHLHLHMQMYGHSLSEFPSVFVPNGKLRDYEGANRLLQDPGVSIFYEIARHIHPDLYFEFKNSGCISFGRTSGDSDITTTETDNVQKVIATWDDVWKEFANCFVDVEAMHGARDTVLLPIQTRNERVDQLLTKYSLSIGTQRILHFLSNNIQNESPNIWRNFYQGPNGTVGFHTDYVGNVREWLVAPRIFRSWARHLPLVLTQNDEIMEWTTKNESGDGLVNNTAKAEIAVVQRNTINAFSKETEK